MVTMGLGKKGVENFAMTLAAKAADYRRKSKVSEPKTNSRKAEILEEAIVLLYREMMNRGQRNTADSLAEEILNACKEKAMER